MLTETTRMMLGIMIITVPTIEFGGTFLLSLWRNRTQAEKMSALQLSFYRAGHAHAGVLVILGLICQILVESASLPDALKWVIRVGVILAPVLVSAGFFVSVPNAQLTAPNGMVRLIYAGAGILAVCLLLLGVGLLLPL
jgi:Ni,Fe-hydrogenase I cytochrome b subunit